MGIVWTKHAQERQRQWEKGLGITREEVEAAVNDPQQVVAGDGDIRIAQRKRGEGVIRVPYKWSEREKKILTIYWTSKVEKYWEPS